VSSYKATVLTHLEIPPNGTLNSELPYIIDDFSLAMHLGVRCKTLWYLIWTKARVYNVFTIPKASGKPRVIHSPNPVLKFIQRRIDQVILKKLPLLNCVGAYVTGKSCRDTAIQHVGQGVRIAMDLKDFFPSHSRACVRNYLKTVGYSHFVSGILADLCTAGFDIDTQTGTRKRHAVPQGSPASPSLCNLIAQESLDKQVLAELGPHGWTYTRYSDDLSLSHPDDLTNQEVDYVIQRMRQLIEAAGYRTNPQKTKVQRRWRRQKMLGMVVNEKTSIPRDVYRKYRSLLYNCVKNGWEVNAARYGCDTVESFPSHLQGKISYFHSIDPVKAAKLKARLDEAMAKHGI